MPILAPRVNSDSNSTACSHPHVSPAIPRILSRKKPSQTTATGGSEFCMPEPPRVERITPISSRADSDAVSFLDLPPEIRNNIYSRVLIFEEYMRPSSKASAIPLLRVCKQVHEEASSIFYAANSFYFYCERFIFPDVSGHISPENFLADYPKGLTWPAARYHIHLTRVVFDTHVSLSNYKNTPMMEEQLTIRFHEFYAYFRSLWAMKERKWTGRIICERKYPMAPLDCMIAFSEDDEDVTKMLLRNVDFL